MTNTLSKIFNNFSKKQRQYHECCDWSHLDPTRISIPPLPMSLNIELSSICNFKGRGGYCPLCAPMLTGGRPKGFIDRGYYEQLVDEVSPFVKTINYVGHGEPTAHPEVWELLGYASNKGINTYICTNGLSITPEEYEKIISANISRIDICLDGMTEEAHKSYRKGSNFRDLINTINDLSVLKRNGKLKSKLSIQTIALKTNEHQIHEIADWCYKLGIGHRIQKASFGHDRIPNQRNLREKYEPKNKELHRQALYRNPDMKEKRPKRIIRCPWAEKAMILHSGDVIKCCYDFEGDSLTLGNLFSQGSFIDVWEGEQHLDLLRQIHLAEIPFCFYVTCDRSYTNLNAL